MFKKVTVFALAFLMAASSLFALEGFDRSYTIPVPDSDLNNGGVGNMISGCDIDEDGLPDIYLVNDNWMDGATEVIPRIYKLENAGSGWEVVWSATIEPFYQNTWPCLSMADLDNDGKMELVWGPVNSTSVTSNPNRVVVYEHAGGDAFGIDDGAGNYTPNSVWTMVEEDDVNLRPMDWAVKDLDDDGTDEIFFADRKGTTSGYYFGVISVDDIPDNGDGSETWTMEISGQDFAVEIDGTENKWAVGSIGNAFYAFDEVEISKIKWNGSDWEYTPLSPNVAGSANQSVASVDLDEDGTEEMIAAIYDWGDDTQKGIYLLQEEADTLKHTLLVSVADYFESRGLWGMDCGDIDGDGYLDFVIGSRGGTTNGRIFRFAYLGGDITDPANYELTVIDEGYVTGDEEGIWSIINVSNVDDDPELEVLYTSSSSYGGSLGVSDSSAPVIVLDWTEGWLGGSDSDLELVVAEEVLLDGVMIDSYQCKPGRILDGGNTIWFGALDYDNSETWVFNSVDGGENFTHNATAISGKIAQMDAFDETTALVCTADGKIYKTTDGGATFTECYSYSLGLGDGWFDGLRVVNSTTAIAYGDGLNDGEMHFVKTTDMGATWTELSGIDYLNSVWGYYTFGLAACNVGESLFFTGYSSGNEAFVFRSYDAGDTWESFAVDTSITDRIRAIAMVNDNDGLATCDDGVFIKTTDGGATWEEILIPDDAVWPNGVSALPDDNTIIMYDDKGVFKTTDLGETWESYGMPDEATGQYMVSGLFSEEDFGYVFSYYGTVYKVDGMEPSAIEVEDVEVADTYVLHQNYPNPFNPTTNIAFDLPKTENIKLVVYDMLGQKVATLVNSNMNAGYHTVQWDGRDMNGKLASTGIYLYQLQTSSMVKTRKMTFIK